MSRGSPGYARDGDEPDGVIRGRMRRAARARRARANAILDAEAKRVKARWKAQEAAKKAAAKGKK